MPPTKNQMAEVLTASAAAQAGILSAPQAVEVLTTNARKMYGFTRKLKPTGLPTDPKTYIYSVTEYGEAVNLGPGFPKYNVPPCEEGEEVGEPLVLDPIHFFEEAKVDVTEHTFVSCHDIAQSIMRQGPGMNAAYDRTKVGWFVSKTYPPAPAEVKAAQEIYTNECKRLLAEGQRFATANQFNEINDMHKRAARWLKQKVTWDAPVQKMVDCPGCGEPVRASAIMHAVPYCGYVFNWVQAIESGMKSLKDCPEKMRKVVAKELGEEVE
jgi:hypothetical protein